MSVSLFPEGVTGQLLASGASQNLQNKLFVTHDGNCLPKDRPKLSNLVPEVRLLNPFKHIRKDGLIFQKF